MNARESAHLPTLAGNGSPAVRRALILSGGGIRCCYQAGALQALSENGMTFNFFDATSGGGINLAAILSGTTPAELVERWFTINLSKTLSLMPFERYLKRDDLVAMGSADAFRRYVLPHMGIDFPSIARATGMHGNFNVLNFTRKVVEEISHTRLDEDLLIAGLSLPGVMPPVTRAGTDYLDAAFVQDANLMAAVRNGAEELWVLWCLGNTPRFYGGLLRIYIQILEMAAHGALHREFSEIAELNRRISAGDSPFGQRGPIRIHLIRPVSPLPLDPLLYLGQISTADLIAIGYQDTLSYLSAMLPQGSKLTPDSTVMTERACDQVSTQALRGKLEPSQTAESAQLPRELTGTLVVEMRTLPQGPADCFLSHGILRMPACNLMLRCLSGSFSQTRPETHPGCTRFTHKLFFLYNKVRYCLVCQKDLPDNVAITSWRGVRTAWQCTLHHNSDMYGQHVAHGTLHMTLKDAIAHLPG